MYAKTVPEWSFVSCARHPARVFFVFYTRGIGAFICTSVAFCGRFVLPVSFLGTRGIGGDHLSRFVGAPSSFPSAAPYSPLRPSFVY